MSSVETGQMPAVETGQTSAAETGQMSAVETRQMYSIKTGQSPVAIVNIPVGHFGPLARPFGGNPNSCHTNF